MNLWGRVPIAVRLYIRHLTRLPIFRTLRFLTLRRIRPVSSVFGYDRGGVRIGRYYIELFLKKNASDIHGNVLEIADNAYTIKFGGSQVQKSDVLHVEVGNSAATIISDLSTGIGIPDNSYDCVI